MRGCGYPTETTRAQPENARFLSLSLSPLARALNIYARTARAVSLLHGALDPVLLLNLLHESHRLRELKQPQSTESLSIAAVGVARARFGPRGCCAMAR